MPCRTTCRVALGRPGPLETGDGLAERADAIAHLDLIVDSGLLEVDPEMEKRVIYSGRVGGVCTEAAIDPDVSTFWTREHEQGLPAYRDTVRERERHACEVDTARMPRPFGEGQPVPFEEAPEEDLVRRKSTGEGQDAACHIDLGEDATSGHLVQVEETLRRAAVRVLHRAGADLGGAVVSEVADGFECAGSIGESRIGEDHVIAARVGEP